MRLSESFTFSCGAAPLRPPPIMVASGAAAPSFSVGPAAPAAARPPGSGIGSPAVLGGEAGNGEASSGAAIVSGAGTHSSGFVPACCLPTLDAFSALRRWFLFMVLLTFFGGAAAASSGGSAASASSSFGSGTGGTCEPTRSASHVSRSSKLLARVLELSPVWLLRPLLTWHTLGFTMSSMHSSWRLQPPSVPGALSERGRPGCGFNSTETNVLLTRTTHSP
mmetsp:Transcript_91729/g.259653  ORF Transcript_91729/g.259653 Transcript_91729/m.259653 type:complete len:222 (-) Transcript_91729:156-821(-)